MWSLFYLAVLVMSVQAKFYTDCGSSLAQIQKVTISNCNDNAMECVLKRNTNATISIEFTPSKEVKDVRTRVYQVFLNTQLPVPLPEPDACKNAFVCPLKAGNPVNYVATWPILKSYPRAKLDFKWRLKNEDNDEDLVCILIRAKFH